MESKQKAIALCRVSTDEQLNNHSLSRQEEAVQKVAEIHNLEIVKMWSGSFSSKCGRNIYRKDLREALDFCKKNKQVKYVIVDEPDRFMRSVNEAGWYIVEFQRLGVSILFSDEKYNGNNSVNKMLLNLAISAGEASNEERARKTKAGHEKAIRDGRYPFVPPLGYRRGKTRGVPEIDPVIGPLLKNQLLRIADGLASPTVALQDFNHSIELTGLKRVPLKMDKWRELCTNPFLCGRIEIHKIVDAVNPDGLHEKLITQEQHEKIVDVFNGRPKNQKGPNTSGNPLYPFNQMITHVGCTCSRSKYNTLVGVTVKNGRGKEYPKYRCRGCDKYLLSRDEAREDIGQIVSSMELTESGRKAFQASLVDVFDQEEGDIADRITQLNSQKANVVRRANELLDRYINEKEPGPARDDMKKRYEDLKAQVKKYDDEINTMGNIDAIELERFSSFAINFINNLASSILNLPPKKMQLCKQLLFPDGFFVDENKNVYTRNISPIYRLCSTKKGSHEPSNSIMVRMKRL